MLELKTGYKLDVYDVTLKERDKGYIWDTIEDCIETFWNDFPYLDIRVRDYLFTEIKYVIYNGARVICYEDVVLQDLDVQFYAPLSEALNKRAERVMNERLEQKKAKEDEEYKLYKKLKEKYETNKDINNNNAEISADGSDTDEI